MIAPYDTRIARLPLPARHLLADRVATDLERELGTLAGKELEVHAGDEYVLAIGPSLRASGSAAHPTARGAPDRRAARLVRGTTRSFDRSLDRSQPRRGAASEGGRGAVTAAVWAGG